MRQCVHHPLSMDFLSAWYVIQRRSCIHWQSILSGPITFAVVGVLPPKTSGHGRLVATGVTAALRCRIPCPKHRAIGRPQTSPQRLILSSYFPLDRALMNCPICSNISGVMRR
jgi:hypothetical protein